MRAVFLGKIIAINGDEEMATKARCTVIPLGRNCRPHPRP